MRLVKLEINGFKSFARKTELEFQDGITAIVGPNGSGKSNIADAVRWVLGEQNARLLRGTKMEDVIFNGTEARKAQSFCEVSLVFDNSDGSLPIDFAEVAITRRAYRTGESEYLINRNACRLKDISELFRDTGIGREGYSVIGQGRVEEILSNRTNERRSAFEEAAGIMKYRVRKEESERKLTNTRANLVRLGDILAGLEARMGPLAEQSSAAREYLKLRDELKDIEINMFIYRYERVTERISAVEASIAELDERQLTLSAKNAALSASCLTEEEKERAVNAAMNDVQTRLISITDQVGVRSGDTMLIKQRIDHLRDERTRVETAVAEYGRRRAKLSAELDSGVAEHGKLSARLAAKNTEVAAAEKRLAELDAKIESMDEDIETRKLAIIDSMNRLADAKSRLSRFDAFKETLTGRLKEIDVSEAAVKADGEKLQAEYKAASDEMAGITAVHDECKAAFLALERERSASQQRCRECDETVREMERRMQSVDSRLKVLTEMKAAHEGYYSSVKNVLRDAAGDASLKRCICGVVAELISVPTKYETAIEMALGPSLQNIVTHTDNDAKLVIEHLRRKQYGRATFLPVGSMHPRSLNQQERSAIAAAGCIGVASELIGYDRQYSSVIESLLGRTVIVEDLQAGIALGRRTGSGLRIATLGGDIINPGGSMTGGSVQKREFSLLGREREIETLEKTAAECTAAVAKAESDAKTLRARLEQLEGEIETGRSELHTQEIALATEREKYEIIKQYADENAAQLARVADERAQVRDNLDDIDRQCAELQKLQGDLSDGNSTSDEGVKAEQKLLYEMRAERETVSKGFTEQKVEQMALQKEHGSVAAEVKRLETEITALDGAETRDRKELAGFDARQNAINEELSAAGASLESEKGTLDKLNAELARLEKERAEHQSALDDYRRQRNASADELSVLEKQSYSGRSSLDKLNFELQHMQDDMLREYELTYENVLPFKKPIAVTASSQRVSAIKREMQALGEINPLSIDEYKLVSEEYEKLRVQLDDLTNAEADLNSLIAELTSKMETMFAAQFEQIQQNFSAVFSELFGGGRAELVLRDKSDILNCDIDIIAQPPGKKLQLLSLLSGGERALTAIALLFSILKLKPAAFCILDEIETSLDEVNVSNFSEYLTKYSAATQFILITHRKGSMEVCNSLYGVAMEEKGVSKVVSARFNQVNNG